MFMIKESDRDELLIEFAEDVVEKHKFILTPDNYGVITNSASETIQYMTAGGMEILTVFDIVSSVVGVFKILDGQGNKQTVNKTSQNVFRLIGENSNICMINRKKVIKFTDQEIYDYLENEDDD